MIIILLNSKNSNAEITIEYPLAQSQKGHYFIGQTPPDSKAIAALVNPVDSQVSIYLNAITVTNISGESLSAEVYLKTTIPEGDPSPYVSCANITIVPTPQPYGGIIYNNVVINPPDTGVPIFSRIAPPYATHIIDGGQIIIPPGSCILVYLGGFLPVATDSVIVAFGWWEERLINHCCEPLSYCS